MVFTVTSLWCSSRPPRPCRYLLMGGLVACLVGASLAAYGLWAGMVAEQTIVAGIYTSSDRTASFVFPGDAVEGAEGGAGSLALESTLELQPPGSSRLSVNASKGPLRSQPEPENRLPNFPDRSSQRRDDGLPDRRDWLLVTSRSLYPPSPFTYSQRSQMAGQRSRPGYVNNVYIGVSGE